MSGEPGTSGDCPRAVLVTGGARSGKSSFAERLALGAGRKPVYVATSAAWDQEMADRIGHHKARRDERWTTVEEQLDLVGTLARHCSPDRVVLVDCLTLWLTNLMLAERDLATDTASLAAAIPDLAGPVVFVTNEVGLGIVPDNAMARAFRDAQGRLNQELARVCDRVVLVACGLPLLLKPNSCPDIQL